MANAATVIPSDAADAAAFARAEVDSYVTLVQLTPIDSVDAFERGNALLTDIRNAEVAHEAKRTAITGPLNASLRAINALFKPLADDLGKAKDTLGRNLMAFKRQQEQERLAAEQRAAAEREAAQAQAAAQLTTAVAAVAEGQEGADEQLEAAQAQAMLADVAMPLAAVAEPLAKGGNAARKRYKAEVTDIPAFLAHVAALLAKGDNTFAESVEIKIGKLNTIGTATQGSLRIPGVTFTLDEKIVARKSK